MPPLTVALLALAPLQPAAAPDPAATAAAAQAAQAAEFITADNELMTPAKVVRVLSELGYPSGEEVGESQTKFNLQGLLCYVISYDDGDLQLRMTFTAADTHTLQAVNEWNRTKRLAKAYVQPGGAATLEADLLNAGGITVAQFKEFVQSFGALLGPFGRHLADGA